LNCYAIIDPKPDIINLTLKTILKQLHLRLDFIDLLVNLIDLLINLINLLVNLIDLFVNLIDLLINLIDLLVDLVDLSLKGCLNIIKFSINSFNPLFNLYYSYSLGSIIII
jgi:hypothetical protein